MLKQVRLQLTPGMPTTRHQDGSLNRPRYRREQNPCRGHSTKIGGCARPIVKVQLLVDIYADGDTPPQVTIVCLTSSHSKELLGSLLVLDRLIVGSLAFSGIGIRSIVIERGSNVRGRRPALAQLNRSGLNLNQITVSARRGGDLQ